MPRPVAAQHGGSVPAGGPGAPGAFHRVPVPPGRGAPPGAQRRVREETSVRLQQSHPAAGDHLPQSVPAALEERDQDAEGGSFLLFPSSLPSFLPSVAPVRVTVYLCFSCLLQTFTGAFIYGLVPVLSGSTIQSVLASIGYVPRPDTPR